MGSHGSPGGMRYNTVPHGSNKSRIGRIFKADDIPLVEHSCGGRTALAASPNQTWPGDSVMPVIRPDLRIFNLSLSDGSGVQRRNQGERLLRHR